MLPAIAAEIRSEYCLFTTIKNDLEKMKMVSVYSDADLLSVYKQKRKVLGVFWTVTLVYAAFCIGWLIYHISLPYNDKMLFLPKLCVFSASAIYVIALFPLMGIKYSRIRRYYKALVNFSEGLKNEEKNYFYMFEEHNLQKDNIDVTYCLFETWNKKKHEWMERAAYFDPEKPLPDFGSGDYVQYIVQSNFILQYRILERGVFEFEEITEDEEFETDDQSEGEEETEEIEENQTQTAEERE